MILSDGWHDHAVTWYARNRPRIRAALVIMVGVGLGLACPYLPEAWRAPCKVAVRVYRALT